MTMMDPPDPVPAGRLPDPTEYGLPPRPPLVWRCPYDCGKEISYDAFDTADTERGQREIDGHTAAHLAGYTPPPLQ